MNGPGRAARCTRVHAIAVVVLLAASALEVWAVAGGQDLLRDGLLLLIAATMIAVAAWG